MEGSDTIGDPPLVPEGPFLADIHAEPEDFLDQVMASEQDPFQDVDASEELVQGVFEEVSETTTVGSDLTSPLAKDKDTLVVTPEVRVHVGELSVTTPLAQQPNTDFSDPSPPIVSMASLDDIQVHPPSGAVGPNNNTALSAEAPSETAPTTTPTQPTKPVDELAVGSAMPCASATAPLPSSTPPDTPQVVACYVCKTVAGPLPTTVPLNTGGDCCLSWHHICCTQHRCPRCHPESSITEWPAEKRPPPVPPELVTDVTALAALNTDQLLAQCVLRKVGKSGTKGVLRARLEKAIEKAKKSTDASTVTSIRQPPNTTAPKAPAAPRSTSKKKAESTTLESPWVELSLAQAAAARWVRPSYTAGL
ncbi:hypothetical protein CYMTET_51094 [Cymbomonas tetramitiformis]|uniref:SAP domain-containing protein n=1 Tax=Cymbomonas tetramitiformis TaxID=36881 RepID=A0AAE0BLZ9_9CHLO|nr:hypothetical protein CYMTET_51094 [Cymbomonas tetramitiformis]